jgi:hypothetical protein
MVWHLSVVYSLPADSLKCKLLSPQLIELRLTDPGRVRLYHRATAELRKSGAWLIIIIKARVAKRRENDGPCFTQ